jgi:DNA-binding protein HU-beta
MAVKKSAKKTTVKKTTAKKAAAKKKTGGKRKATAEETATGSKPGEGAAAKKRAPVSKSAEPKKATKKPKDKVSSTSVNLGHVFSLRPRVSKTFRQADFLTARQLLQDEDYANIEEAARAVAEKALDLTHKGPPKRGFKPGR